MRKLVCLLISLLMCVSMTLPVLAEEVVPSAALEVKEAVMNSEDVKDCVVVTSVKEAREKSTDIAQEERGLLVEIFDALSNGSMVLPVEGPYSIVDLMDVSLALEACREVEEHQHEKENVENILNVKFGLKVEDNVSLIVLFWVAEDETWVRVESALAISEETLSVTLPQTGPVVILAQGSGSTEVTESATEVVTGTETETAGGHSVTGRNFVPSITYKPYPEIVPVENGDEAYIGVIRDQNGEILDYIGHECLEITPIAHVWDDEVEVPEEVEKLLLFVYEALNDGSMKLPYEKHEADLDPANMVIRDLFDARWVCEEHPEMLEENGITFEIVFDLGVVADAEIYVMTYDEETKEWSPVVDAVNNGDGTVTCTFEHLCAVEFSMPVAAAAVSTEEAQSPNVLPWIIVLIVAAAAVVCVVIAKNKKKAAV